VRRRRERARDRAVGSAVRAVLPRGREGAADLPPRRRRVGCRAGRARSSRASISTTRTEHGRSAPPKRGRPSSTTSPSGSASSWSLRGPSRCVAPSCCRSRAAASLTRPATSSSA
jgi:hypothetical protein